MKEPTRVVELIAHEHILVPGFSSIQVFSQIPWFQVQFN